MHHPHQPTPRNNRLQVDLFWNSSARDALPMFYQTLNEAALRRALGEDVLKEIRFHRGRVDWEEDVFRGKMMKNVGFSTVKPKKIPGKWMEMASCYHGFTMKKGWLTKDVIDVNLDFADETGNLR